MSVKAAGVITADKDLDNCIGCNFFFIDCTAGNITLTLPTIYIDGQYYQIIRIDNSSNTLTLQARTGFTVNNLASINILPNQYFYMISCNKNFVCPISTFSFS